MLSDLEIELPEWAGPLAKRLLILAAIAGAIVGVLLIGPLHSVFDAPDVTGPVEYTNAPVALSDYLKSSDEDVSISLNGSVDATRVGTQHIPVTLTKWFITNDTEVVVKVQDTQAPVISLKKAKIKAEVGEKFDPSENLESVSDPVDGKLKRVSAEPEAHGTQVGEQIWYEEGWYMIDAPFTPEEAGKTTVKVTSCDRHGNRTEETFDVEVIDPLAGVTLKRTTKVLEYGSEKLDPLTLVECSDPDTLVLAKRVNVSKVGTKKVTYTLKKHKSVQRRKRTFRIRDTQPPTISLAQQSVRVAQYESYDPRTNVIAVNDPVDGALAQVESLPAAAGTKVGREVFYEDGGWFMLSGAVDVNTVGTYPVSVTAADKHGNEVTASFDVVVVDPLEGVSLTQSTGTIEYGRGSVNPTSYVRCSDPSVELSAPSIDTSQTGAKSVVFTLRKGRSQRQATLSFTVADTQAPSISLSSGTVSVKEGASYDPRSNVRSVSDPVDGSLSYVSSAPASYGNGWYTVSGSYDTGTPGSYTLRVTACDRNGNRTTRDFTLRVTAS